MALSSKNTSITIIIVGILFVSMAMIVLFSKMYSSQYDNVKYRNVVTKTQYIWKKPPESEEVTTTINGLKTGDIVKQNDHYYLVNPDGTGTEVPPPSVLK